MGLQNVITGLGGVAVQSVINGFGTIFVAGFTAANKLYGLLETAAVSYSYAVVSFVMLTFARLILSCFLSGEESVLAQTLEIGFAFLKILSAFFWLLYLLYIVRACVQGMGNTLLPMCSSFLQLVMRVGCAFFLTKKIGQMGVFWGEVCAWLLADVFLCFCLLWVYSRQFRMRKRT